MVKKTNNRKTNSRKTQPLIKGIKVTGGVEITRNDAREISWRCPDRLYFYKVSLDWAEDPTSLIIEGGCRSWDSFEEAIEHYGPSHHLRGEYHDTGFSSYSPKSTAEFKRDNATCDRVIQALKEMRKIARKFGWVK